MSFRCAFTIQSDTRYLAPLRQWIEAAARVDRRRLPKKAIIACSLALIEAVDNAIFHAHRRERELPIRVSMEFRDRRIVLEVIDTGGGLDHPHVPRPDGMATHGRGLFLIRELMHSVRSEVKDGQHCMKMVYRL